MVTLLDWNIWHVVPHFAPDKQTRRLFQNDDHYRHGDIEEEEMAKIGERAIAAMDPLTACAVARWYLFFKFEAKALTLFHMAAEWGDRVAQFYYGSLAFGPDDIMRFVWWGKALQRRLFREHVLTHNVFSAITVRLSDKSVPDNILFEIGRALEIHVNDVPKRHKLFFRDAVMFYKRCCEKATSAVLCWLMICKRENLLVPDIRRLIARRYLRSDMWGALVRGRTTTRKTKKVKRYSQE